MQRVSCFGGLAMTVAVVLMGGALRAEDAVDVEGAESRDAKGCFDLRQYDACFREGKRRYAADDFPGARDAYLEGWTLQRNYEIAGNLGNVELELENYAAALTYLKYSLDRLAPSQRGSEVEDRLRQKISEALVHVGARHITVEPPDAVVSIDGAPVALDSELWIALEPGEHVLLVEREGYEPRRQVLDVRAGTEESLTIALGGRTGAEGEPATTGESTGPSAPQLAVGISGLVLGAGGVAAAVVLGVLSSQRADQVTEMGAEVDAQGQNGCGPGSPLVGSTTCADLADASSDEVTFRGAAIGAGIAGGALLVGSILYLAIPISSEPEGATPTTAIHVQSNGFVFRGTF